MKRYDVVITEQAEQDLLNSYYYILFELKDGGAAENFRTTLYKKISGLEYLPNGYERFEDVPEYRVAHALSYKIFYYVDDAKEKVVITRVFHTKQKEQM